MPTLIKETGALVANANAYADMADGDAYADASLYAAKWYEAGENDKLRALIVASRALDQMFAWNGYKAAETQAMQWPRQQCPDPDIANDVRRLMFQPSSGYLDETQVPKIIQQAACQLAIEMLAGNRIGDKAGAGLKRLEVFEAVDLEFDLNTAPLVIPDSLRAALSRYGESLEGRAGMAKLQRV